MAHNIATINGKSAFFGTRPAWHNLGQIVSGAQNWEQAMVQAQLDWEVSKQQLINPINGKVVNSWGIFRNDNSEMLGAVGNQYVPIQNKYAFDFVDAILEAENGCHYESAGALGNGEKIWCLAKLDKTSDITGTGDIHEHFLLFTTSHDGSTAATCKLTTVRVVCNNTLNQALKLNGEFTRIKHTKNAEVKLNAAKNLVSGAINKIGDIETKLIELSKRIVTKDSMKQVMSRLFGDFEESTRSANKVRDILGYFEVNDNNQFPEIRGTAYNLLNSITEYTDHASNVRQTEGRKGMSDIAMRSENVLFGTGSDLKEKALDIIMESTTSCGRVAERVYVPVAAPVYAPAVTSYSGLLDDILSAH